MAQNNYQALFIPGLPSEKKQYHILLDIERSGGMVSWLTYTGTYERQDQGEFSLESCISDVTKELDRLERSGRPYVVIAYSFSTAIIRYVDFSHYQNCAGILLYSPIMNLSYQSSQGDFNSLLSHLKVSGAVQQIGSWDEGSRTFISWLQDTSSYQIPAYIFIAGQDEVTFSNNDISEMKDRIQDINNYVHFINIPQATHKINSYSSTIASWYQWGIIAYILLSQALPENCSYYLWGSVLSPVSWSRYSDIDILIIGDLTPSSYEAIATIAQKIEDLSGIHLGVSTNAPDDLNRDQYIRRNRGAVFLRELKTHAIPLGNTTSFRDVTDEDVVADALNTNRILRADIAKLLLGYYKKKPVTKDIVKSCMQAVRLSQYAKDGTALYETIVANDDEAGNLLKRCLEIKHQNYSGVSFEELYALSNSVQQIVKEQEEI